MNRLSDYVYTCWSFSIDGDEFTQTDWIEHQESEKENHSNNE